jgi:hypothetical protein
MNFWSAFQVAGVIPSRLLPLSVNPPFGTMNGMMKGLAIVCGEYRGHMRAFSESEILIVITTVTGNTM